jgi:diacylglycerol kinase (ATP)
MKTLVIVNPRASAGKAVRHYRELAPELGRVFGECEAVFTQTIGEVHQAIDRVVEEGSPWRVLAVGGDGTNHVVVNALARHREADVIFGTLPVGTGQDWARTLGVPGAPVESVRWLARAQPIRCDLGRLRCIEVGEERERFFLNVASTGISSDIVMRVNAARLKGPWTFLLSTVGTLMWYRPTPMRIVADGQELYEGDSYILAVATGRYFGHGMMIAPDAEIDDGLFDIILVEGMPRIQALGALPSIFTGEHIKRSDVHVWRGRHVEVHLPPDTAPAVGMELDGEEARGQNLVFETLPGALRLLAHSSAA